MNYYNNQIPTFNPYGLPTPTAQYQTPQAAQGLNSASQNPPQIQNGGFIRANEEEALNYPVAPGNSVNFIDPNTEYVFVKTMGFSQFDNPRFEKYRLVKENEGQPADATTEPKFSIEAAINDLRGELANIKELLQSREKTPKKASDKQRKDDK